MAHSPEDESACVLCQRGIAVGHASWPGYPIQRWSLVHTLSFSRDMSTTSGRRNLSRKLRELAQP